MWQKTGSGNEDKPGLQIINECLFFSGASLCFGQPETLLCEAKNIPPVSLTIKMEAYMKTIKNRNINGRPAKKPSEKKAYKITVKMATEEYYSLKAKAGLAGINRSEFIRQCICSTVIKQRLSPRTDGTHPPAFRHGQ